MKLIIKENPLNVHTWKVIDQLPQRVAAVIRELPVEVAKMAFDELAKIAPDDIEGYPDMLVLRGFRVSGFASVTGIVAHPSAYTHTLRMQDAGDTVIYVEPVVTNGVADPGATVLAKYGPWTMGTLPYEPTTRQAKLVSRKVSKGEVGRIITRLKVEIGTVLAELKAAGIAPKREHQTLLRRKVRRDIAFEVVRREFGIGQRHSAHWRPTIARARKKFVEQLMKRRFIRWLAVPSEMRWKRRTTIKPERRSPKSYEGFQKLVAKAGT